METYISEIRVYKSKQRPESEMLRNALTRLLEDIVYEGSRSISKNKLGVCGIMSDQ